MCIHVSLKTIMVMKRFLVLSISLAAISTEVLAAGQYGEPKQPGWLTFIGLVMIVWGVLEIILFFKIWGMTNDVRRLTNHFCRQTKVAKSDSVAEPKYMPTNPNEYEVGDYDHRLDEVKVGDKVRRDSDGKILEVIAIGENVLECRGGMLDGIHSYPKDALSIV